MKIRNLIMVAIAVLMTLVSCDPAVDLGLPSIKIDGDGTLEFEVAGGDQQITLTATRDWQVECDADWLDILPASGSASAEAQTITVSARSNPGMDRTADVKFTIGMAFKTLTVTQKGPGGSAEALIVYANDFDKEIATQTYGTSGDKWPYCDQFDGWKNEKGTGAAGVEYVFKGMSARNNANSNSNYSDYEGSGNNNLLFSTNNYFAIKNITLGTPRTYTVSFGTEKYAGDGDNTFVPAEFHVYISKDASKWVELQYAFPAEFKNGRWDLASSTFTLPADVQTLHMYFKSDLTGGHRIDDLKIVVSDAEGTAVDFSTGVEIELDSSTGGGNNGGQESDATAIYHNNFDKTVSAKVNNNWPYLDQFDGWKNAAGTGAADVTYTFKNASARASSDNNNIWLPKSGAYFSVQGIALGGTTSLKLTFSSICGSPGTYKKQFNSEVLKVYVSSDNAKWVDLDYEVTVTEKEFESAVTTFSVPEGTASLSIAFEKVADETDGYRIDDVKLVASETAGTSVDFTTGVEKNFTDGASGDNGSEEGGETVVVTKSIETGDYWIMTADKSKVVIPIDDSEGKGFGYWNVTAAAGGVSTAENAFTFTWVEGKGYTIQDSDDRYHYMTDYNSFSISTSEQNNGSHYWAVTANTDGTYSIVNTVSGKTVQMSSYGNFCPYTDVTGDLPTLVKADDPVEGGDDGSGDEGGEVTPPEGGEDPGDDNGNTGGDVVTGTYAKIESVEDLAAGTYYMAGYLTEYSYKSNGETFSYDWSDYPYHVCTGVSTDLYTSNYSFADGELVKDPDAKYEAVDVVLESVDGKADTYYVKIGGKYLYSSKCDKRSLASGDEPVEWVASNHSKGGISLTTTLSEGDVILGTAGAASNLLRSYKSPANSLKYGLVFFKVTE